MPANVFNEWISISTVHGRKLRDSERGKALARERFKQIQRSDPLRALLISGQFDLTARRRCSFSNDYSLVEEPHDGFGDITVLEGSTRVAASHFRQTWVELSDGRRFQVVGSITQNLQSAKQVPIHGFILASNSTFVMQTDAARCVTVADAATLVADGALPEPLLHRSTACYVGDTLRWYASRAEAVAAGAALRGRRLAPDDPSWAVGQQTALVVLMRNAALTWGDEATALAAVRAGVTRGFAWLRNQSYGQLRTSLTFAPVVYDVTASFSGSVCDLSQAAVEAAVEGHGSHSYSVAAFSRTLVVCPHNALVSWAGLATVPGARSWYNGASGASASVVAHEIGHNLGLHHANFRGAEYGDTLDVMGDGYLSSGGQLKASFKHSLFWLPPATVATLALHGATAACPHCVGAGNVTLAAFDQSLPLSGSSAHLLAMVDLSSGSNVAGNVASASASASPSLSPTSVLDISVRSRGGVGVAGGVGLSVVPWGRRSVGASSLQDVVPSTFTPQDSALSVGDTFLFAGDVTGGGGGGGGGGGWYTGPRLLIRALSTTFPAGYAARPGVFEAPHDVTVTVSFLDRHNDPARGIGCDSATAACAATATQALAAAVALPEGQAGSHSGNLSSATAPALFTVSVTQPRLLTVDSCVAGTHSSLGTAIGLYGAVGAQPLPALRYGASVRVTSTAFALGARPVPSWAAAAGAAATAVGCAHDHATLTAVLLPEQSPYHIVVQASAAAAALTPTPLPYELRFTWPASLTGTGSGSSGCDRITITGWNHGAVWVRSAFTFGGSPVWTYKDYLFFVCGSNSESGSSEWWAKKSLDCSAAYYDRLAVDGAAAATIAGASCLCPAGTVANGAKTLCTPCPAGQTSAADATSCSCAAGTTASGGGACSQCVADTYSSDGTSCTPCPHRAASPAGSTWRGACTCPAGLQPNADASACVGCPIGSYKSSAGNYRCAPCPSPTTTAAPNATSLAHCSVTLPPSAPIMYHTVCPLIHYTRGGGGSSWADGQYALGGFFAGRPFYNATGAASSSGRVIAYSTQGWYRFVLASEVDAALAWHSFDTSGSRFPQDSPEIQCLCPLPGGGGSGSGGGVGVDPQQGSRGGTCRCAGDLGVVSGKCAVCPAGTRANSTQHCVTCAANGCTNPCARQGACVCKPGYTEDSSGRCRPCAADTYKAGAGNSGSCLACPAGQTSAPGSAACACPLGYRDSGAAGCVDVNECAGPTGLAARLCTASAGQQCVNTPGSWHCTCPAGQGVLRSAAADPSACARCPQHSYSPAGSPQCTRCPPAMSIPAHTWRVAAATSASQCVCDAGTLPRADGVPGCLPPQLLRVSGSRLQPALDGCYAPHGRHNGAPLFRRTTAVTAVGGAATQPPIYFAYVTRNGGEWALLPDVARPARRFAVAARGGGGGRGAPTPVGATLLVFDANGTREFVSGGPGLAVRGVPNCSCTNCSAATVPTSGGAAGGGNSGAGGSSGSTSNTNAGTTAPSPAPAPAATVPAPAPAGVGPAPSPAGVGPAPQRSLAPSPLPPVSAAAGAAAVALAFAGIGLLPLLIGGAAVVIVILAALCCCCRHRAAKVQYAA